MNAEKELRMLGIVAALLVAQAALATEMGYDTLIAHRGESKDAPENTLPAYKMAVERGFGFECDIYMSKDGRLYTFHDGDLKRTSGGKNEKRCTEASWEDEVSKLNVGGWGQWAGSKFDPTRPALLEEVLALARPGRKIYVEVKGGDSAAAWVPKIKETFAKEPKATPETVLFISFHRKTCAELKRLMPEYKVFWLTGKGKADEIIGVLKKLGVDGVDLHYKSEWWTEESIKQIRDAGFEVHFWTIDDYKTAKEALRRGGQTVTTNCAKKLLDQDEDVPEDVAAVKELLAIPSVSKDVAANDRAIEWMQAYLEKRGVWCKIEKFPKDGRKILYAATKEGLMNPDYIVVTHLDVVDAPEEMFKPEIKDGRIYARGACDTKVNAFCGAKALVALNGKGSVACIFSSDEEISGNTTKHMVSLGYGVPGKMVVTLDCASMTPDIRYSCKGNGYYKVTAVGKSGHSSNPGKCVNPNYILAEAALKVRDNFPFQKPGEWGDVASVTVLNAGDSFNRIPETAEMVVNVRFVEMDGLERHLQTIADVTGLKTELIRGTPPGIGPNDAPDILRLQAAMKRLYPERSCNLIRSLAATDARYFTQFKKPIPMFGMACDGGHSACEWCEIKDIDRFTSLLVEVMSE